MSRPRRQKTTFGGPASVHHGLLSSIDATSDNEDHDFDNGLHNHAGNSQPYSDHPQSFVESWVHRSVPQADAQLLSPTENSFARRRGSSHTRRRSGSVASPFHPLNSTSNAYSTGAYTGTSRRRGSQAVLDDTDGDFGVGIPMDTAFIEQEGFQSGSDVESLKSKPSTRRSSVDSSIDDVFIPLEDEENQLGTSSGSWPDTAVLDEWATKERAEQESAEAANLVRESVDEAADAHHSGRLRPRYIVPWERPNVLQSQATMRFSYFREDLPATIHSPTIGGLLQPGQSFSELFPPSQVQNQQQQLQQQVEFVTPSMHPAGTPGGASSAGGANVANSVNTGSATNSSHVNAAKAANSGSTVAGGSSPEPQPSTAKAVHTAVNTAINSGATPETTASAATQAAQAGDKISSQVSRPQSPTPAQVEHPSPPAVTNGTTATAAAAPPNFLPGSSPAPSISVSTAAPGAPSGTATAAPSAAPSIAPSTAHSPTPSPQQEVPWWLDINCPTEEEMRLIARAFGVHPLTTEDITLHETREKVELFYNYYFVCFTSFDVKAYEERNSPNEAREKNDEDESANRNGNGDTASLRHRRNSVSGRSLSSSKRNRRRRVERLKPLAIFSIVFKTGIITVHYRPTPHTINVRRRIRLLRDYLNVSSDWISYALIDDITDGYGPLINAVDEDVQAIEDSILHMHGSHSDDEDDEDDYKPSKSVMSTITSGTSSTGYREWREKGDMLRWIGEARKRVMSLLSLLSNKADVIKGFSKRVGDQWSGASRSEIAMYLSDIQDHLITMTQSLNHYEKLLARAHSNYLAQLNIDMTRTNNEMNDVLSKISVLGTIVLPMNIVTGLWGMNCFVPGQGSQDTGSLSWFWSIVTMMFIFAVTSYFVLMRFV